MATEFEGLKKEDKDELVKATRLYASTGKDLSGVIDRIPVVPDDPKEKEAADKKRAEENNKKAEESLQRQAEATRRREEADQESRRIAARTDALGNEIQDENPGPGQPAMVTERAKAAGVSRKGEEPKIARPTK